MPTSHGYHIATPKPFAAPPNPATGGTSTAGITINKQTAPGAFNTSAQAMLYQMPVFDPTGVKNHKGTAFSTTPVEVGPGQALPTVPQLWLKNHPGGLTGVPLFQVGSEDQYQQLNPIIGDQRRSAANPTTIESLRHDLPSLPFPPLSR